MNKDSESYKKRQRYWKIYYEIHREEKRAYDRAKYVPHPRPKIIRKTPAINVIVNSPSSPYLTPMQ